VGGVEFGVGVRLSAVSSVSSCTSSILQCSLNYTRKRFSKKCFGNGGGYRCGGGIL